MLRGMTSPPFPMARTLTFTKQISGFVITLAAPLEAEAQPTRANVKVTREIPAGATFKVEATNNPFDPSPAWEDCTNAVIQGVAHVFENTINTAVKFGLNIRVTVERGDAISACWVSSIGGGILNERNIQTGQAERNRRIEEGS